MKRSVPLKRTGFQRKATPDKTKTPVKTAQAAKTAKPRASGRTSRRGHASAAEQRYMDRVAALGCLLCRHHGFWDTPAQLHHPRTGLYGMAMRASNWDVIPLCPMHHTGSAGVHAMGHDEFTQYHGISELDLLAWVRHLIDLPDEAQS